MFSDREGSATLYESTQAYSREKKGRKRNKEAHLDRLSHIIYEAQITFYILKRNITAHVGSSLVFFDDRLLNPPSQSPMDWMIFTRFVPDRKFVVCIRFRHRQSKSPGSKWTN